MPVLVSAIREGRFSVTKKLYIHITEKLLNLLSMGDVSPKKNAIPDNKSSSLEQVGEIDIAAAGVPQDA